MLGGSVAVHPGPSHHTRAGTIPSIFLTGTMATSRRRVPLPGLSARPTAPVVLGPVALVWHHSRQWLHLAALCGRTLLAPPTAVGCHSAFPVAHLGVFPRPLYECLSLYGAACVLQCRVFWPHWATIDMIAKGGLDGTIARDNL